LLSSKDISGCREKLLVLSSTSIRGSTSVFWSLPIQKSSSFVFIENPLKYHIANISFDVTLLCRILGLSPCGFLAAGLDPEMWGDADCATPLSCFSNQAVLVSALLENMQHFAKKAFLWSKINIWVDFSLDFFT
jgi:hypothetical protein